MADYLDTNKTARQNIEAMQNIINSPDFQNNEKYPVQEKKKIYASIYATRMAVNALPGKAKTLDVSVPQDYFNSYLDQMMKSTAFEEFIQQNGHQRIQQLATNGHGGIAEREFRTFVARRSKLDPTVPGRYMPSARGRIDTLKTNLLSMQPTSEEAITAYSEIFRARRSVGAIHGKNVKTTLPLIIGGGASANYAQVPDLSQSNTFRGFVAAKGRQIFDSVTARRTHGGAAEEMYKDYVKELDHIPEDVSKDYMPKANERIEALKEKVKDAGFGAKEQIAKNDIYTEIFATRMAVDAVRGKGKTLDVVVEPEKFKREYDKLANSAAFQNFLTTADQNKLRSVCGTDRGHAGEMEDMFKEHIRKMDAIPEDTPKKFMPTAEKRIEALQAKLNNTAFQLMEPEERTERFIELMATRNAVNAIRKDKKSLDVDLDPKKLKEAKDVLKADPVFMQFVREKPITIRDAAVSGHGGAIEDRYKDYVRDLDHIPEGVNEKFMPTAYDHIEAINKRIKSDDFALMSDEKKTELMAEIIASRTAVGAERKKPDTLKKKFNAKEMNKTYNTLKNNAAFKSFVASNADAVKTAALSGHGGLVEDKFKEYILNLDHIPEGVPDKYMPTALERTEKLKEKIAACNDPGRVKVMTQELIATRMAVNSTMGKKDSLKVPLKADRLNAEYKKLGDNETFKSYQETKGLDGLKAAAGKRGHGGELEKDYMKHVVDKTVQADGIIPKGIDNRHKPMPNELNERLKKELGDASKLSPEHLHENEANIKKMIATAMCMKRINIENATEIGKKNQIDHDKLNKDVNKLMNSQKFKNMINDMGLKNAALKASKGVTKIFADFNKASDINPFVQPAPALQVQNQAQLNLQQQDQPVVNNVIQPQNNNNQANPQLNNNNQNQPRRNSYQPRQMPGPFQHL